MPRAKAAAEKKGADVVPFLFGERPEPGAAPPEPELKDWALVELFGHQRIVGFLSQQTFGSGVLFRVDVPDLLKDSAGRVRLAALSCRRGRG